ncbi:dipeptide ABC transporter ATP-binding protein [Epibacterium sp. SM1969]|uniref:Dipeptide ABC transporter ATP-binding protein n=1 Tax=Tritonibacter aquimaris TaxID=2663379 RepID=A0A844APD8_9RHOB|nr:ABC transporter ATP-binding protein [Tritonibacter aquimaris]MQY42563.1 dipeptide ABC transporter ATP-binding protein [Tritonibacter aquimaris]
MTDPLIQIDQLSIGYTNKSGQKTDILKSVSLTLRPGETLGIVGESGSGKSTVALAMMGFLKQGLSVHAGRASFAGQDVFALSEPERARLRGSEIALIPQNAGQALTPTLTIGAQIDEALKLHTNLSGAERQAKIHHLLERVRLPKPHELATRYPHELSGGQQQRAAVAMALAGRTKALILDEPTTGLDVTTQAHILEFLRHLAHELGVAMVYVSHDMGVIARVADQVAVMYQGEIVEHGPVRQVLKQPQQDYTRALLAAIPRLDAPLTRPKPADGPDALMLEDLAISYHRPSLLDRILKRPAPKANVEHINLSLKPGQTLGLVGESGSGKSTILRAIAGLIEPQRGAISLSDKTSLTAPVSRRDRKTLRRVQMIFQNADASLNPRQTVAEILGAPLRLYFDLSGAEARQRAAQLLQDVRLPATYLDRFPGQLSGGEKQRVGLARAFAAKPEVALCDEITSALDVSVQATALELLDRLQRENGSSYVFVSHDLAVVRQVSDWVAVLYQGRLCELGPVEALYTRPFHPYTRLLLGAVLAPDPDITPTILSDADDPRSSAYAELWRHHAAEIATTDSPLRHDLGDGHMAWLNLDPKAVANMKVSNHVR